MRSTLRSTLRARFEAKFEKVEEGCWEWQAAKYKNGYGAFDKHLSPYAHRTAYELYVGPIPAGLVIDHLCRNRACVRPDHLEAVPQRENAMRGAGVTFVASRTDTCLRGHALTPENTMTAKDGRRRCLACNRAWRRAKHGWQGHEGKGWEAAKTHCPRGHAYDEANTRVSNGSRECRACRREKARERWRAAHPGSRRVV